jgi:hydroxymethylpyrimidine pyrophosphatase-like HAD family hydrolase
MKYKFLAIDLDGTLLNKRKKIPKKNLLVLNKYVSNGGLPIICSGRSIVSVQKKINVINLALTKPIKYAICFNGSYIVDIETGKKTEYLIQHSIAYKIYEYCKLHKLNF